MEDKIKTFSVRGEFKMSENDTFKSAKKFAFDSAVKTLDDEVKKFLSVNAKDFNVELNENDIVEISKKFLKTDEPHYIRELLHGDDMICYAEIKAEINREDLADFLKNFHVFELEKKILELEKIIADKDKIIAELKQPSGKFSSAKEKFEEGKQYYFKGAYSDAINCFTKAIELNPGYREAYTFRGYCYRKVGRHDKADFDLKRAEQLQ